MAWARAGVVLVAAVALGLLAVSGDEAADPRTPAGVAGVPAPFLGTAVAGSGELTAAVDAYGDVVDLREGPAGRALIENPAARQAAGTVDVSAGIVPRVRLGDGPARALWEASAVRQRYLAGTNVVRTAARFGRVRVVETVAVAGRELGVVLEVGGGSGSGSEEAVVSVSVAVDEEVRCRRERQPDELHLHCWVGAARPVADGGAAVVRAAVRKDRVWLGAARSLGARAPGWARQMYERSLLTLRALTDSQTGAVTSGSRDGWAYVWPRDAGTAAIALAEAGYRDEAELATRFLLGVGLEQAARFHGDGSPVPGRAAQGDAIGWTAAAAEAAGLIGSAKHAAWILGDSTPPPWRNRADYWEGEPGDYLGNAIASRPWSVEHPIAGSSDQRRVDPKEFATPRGLTRRPGDPSSGLDSAAAWAVRPFSLPRLYPSVRRTLDALVADATPFGITPGSAWPGGIDPWTAPTAWTAWAYAALARDPRSADRAADRRQALRLLAALRRAATPAGALPERVDARTGIPTSTTPLAWTHAFAILTLRELWP